MGMCTSRHLFRYRGLLESAVNVTLDLLFNSDLYSEPLGMENGSIPNDAIKASSELDEPHSATRARLNTKPEGELMGAWVPLESDENQWLQVDLGKVAEITKISTQGGGEGVEQHVASYILLFSEDEENVEEYKENGELKVSYNGSHTHIHWHATLSLSVHLF